jgi:polysaccharide biosynthesis/export protein
MKSTIKILIFALITVSLSSCYNYQSLRLLQENSLVPAYDKSEYRDYRIQVNDMLIYRLITSDQTISGLIGGGTSIGSTNQVTYRVYPDGSIDLPFIDSIHVAGLTIKEATTVIENRFKEIIPDAAIKLGLGNKSFTILGDIGTGIYPIYKEKMTIFQALALSGDFNEQSDRRHIRIIRETVKGTTILNFDIRPKSIIDSKYYYIYPNDIIYVQREFSSFYKVNSYSSILGVISYSLSLLFSVLAFTRN